MRSTNISLIHHELTDFITNNITNNRFMSELILPELSYKTMGVLFKVHNELGPVQKEKNYQDAVELLFKKNHINYEREKEVELEVDGEKCKGFFLDFLVEQKIDLELKAKKFISHEDVRQSLRYLKSTNLPLAIVANFKRKSLEYKRLINPDVVDDYKAKDSKNSGNNSGLNSVNSVEIGANKKNTRERMSSRILGIDYGEKRIGLAISDAEQSQAFAYDTFPVDGKFWGKINAVIEDEKIDRIVVGLPLGMKGEYTQKTEEVVIFIEQLENNVKVPVETEDERLSTVEGLQFSGGHGKDESAARVILQRYLDRKSNE